MAKLAETEVTRDSRLTRTGALLGTPYYMSPEQARGEADIGHKADIYSMGVVLYEMLTGALPFSAANYNALLVKIMIETPPDPASVNPRIHPQAAEAIRVAMARSPDARFSSCAEFRAKLLPLVSAGNTDRAAAHTSGSAPAASAARGAGRAPATGRRRDAIFVGLWPTDADVALEDGGGLQVVALDSTQDLLGALEESTPDLIVANASTDLTSLAQQSPDCRCPVIVIDMLHTHEELAIHQWQQAGGHQLVRHAPLAQLGDEINRLCAQRVYVPPPGEEVGSIGLDSVAERDGRTYRVATEVFPGATVRVVTRICSGELVVGTLEQRIEASEEGPFDHVKVVAEVQHNLAVEQAKLGKHG